MSLRTFFSDFYVIFKLLLGDIKFTDYLIFNFSREEKDDICPWRIFRLRDDFAHSLHPRQVSLYLRMPTQKVRRLNLTYE